MSVGFRCLICFTSIGYCSFLLFEYYFFMFKYHMNGSSRGVFWRRLLVIASTSFLKSVFVLIILNG